VQSTSRARTSFWLVLTLMVGLAVVARPADASSGDFYAWAKWRLGHAPYTCQAGAPWVRPNVGQTVHASWWKRLEGYRATPCPQTPAPPEDTTDAQVVQVKLNARENALRNAVNAERRRHGLALLALDAGLQRAARAHTANMIRFGYFGHDWNNGAPFGTWVNRYTGCITAGEILAFQSPRQTAANAVRQWLGSPPHRAALLAGTWRAMGVELTPRNATVEFGRSC
jgi:uncharacterized protein YkwD